MASATSAAITATERRRVDEPMQPPSGPSAKYRNLWLDDGNIVLQCAEGSFRVHRSLLAAQSEVFRDMFDLATPTVDSGNFVPVVQLSDDTDQMYTFLRSLIFHDDPVQDSVNYTDQILDIFELSRKYVVPIMQKACMDSLKALFPDTLEAYQLTLLKRMNSVSFRASLRCLIVATTHNLPSIVPACYLYIGYRFYLYIFDIDFAGSWPADLSLIVYSNVVRNLQQLLKLKREILDSFSDDWEQDYFNDPSHRHQVPVLLKYYGGTNSEEEHYEEALSLFLPEWMATETHLDYE